MFLFSLKRKPHSGVSQQKSCAEILNIFTDYLLNKNVVHCRYFFTDIH